MAARSETLGRNRDFLTLWAGQTISLLGSQVTLLALPLTAVLTLRATPIQMGVLRAAQYAPALLIGLFAGVVIDRMRRRPLLIAADVGRAVLLGSIPLAAALGLLTMGYLYGVALLVGTLTILFEVAYLAFVPGLVGRSQLVAANGRLEASQSVASIAGPGLGGFLVQALSAPLAIAADALSFLVSVACLFALRGREVAPAATHRPGIWREIGEGLRVVAKHTILRATVISSGITNFFAAILNSLFVLYAVRVLGITPAGIGIIFLVGSVGGLCGALVAGRASRWLGLGRAILLGMLLIATGYAVLPLASGTPAVTIPLLTVGSVIGAVGDSFYNVNVVSLRQSLIPDRLLGRVSASSRFIIWGAQPFGALLGGVLGERVGLRPALGLVVGGFLMAFVSLLFSPIRALREQPQPLTEDSAGIPVMPN